MSSRHCRPGECVATASTWANLGVRLERQAVLLKGSNSILICRSKFLEGLDEGVVFPSSSVNFPVNYDQKNYLGLDSVLQETVGLQIVKSCHFAQNDNGTSVAIHVSKINQASSVSITLDRPYSGSVQARKRLQNWFTGIYVTEKFRVSNLGQSGLSGVVRRTVPRGEIVICGPETKILLEDPIPSADSGQSTFDFLLPPLSAIAKFLIKQRVAGAIKVCPYPTGIIFHGPPGVGKSFAVHHFVDELLKTGFNTHLINPTAADLTDPTSGKATLCAAFKSAVKHAREAPENISVVFLDELDFYAYSRTLIEQRTNHTRLLMELFDGLGYSGQFGQIIVLGATNRVSVIDQALRSFGRFSKDVAFRLPNEIEREQFVRANLPQSFIHTSAVADVVKHKCVGYSQADIIALLRSCQGDFEVLLHRAIPRAAALRDATRIDDSPQRSSVDHISGQDDVKLLLRQSLEWPLFRHKDLERMGLRTLYRGILMYGPPGCAKTSLIRATINSLKGKVAFYALSGADIYSSGFGDAEAHVRDAFAKARERSPCVLFFDELDSLVGTRDEKGGSGSSVQGRVLSTFLNEMDGIDSRSEDNVLVVGATNAPWNIDNALLRAGRFDKLVFVGPPDAKSLLNLELCKMGCEDIDVAQLLPFTGNMSGADLIGACRLAALRALGRGVEERPSASDISEALREGVRSCTPERLKVYEDFATRN